MNDNYETTVEVWEEIAIIVRDEVESGKLTVQQAAIKHNRHLEDLTYWIKLSEKDKQDAYKQFYDPYFKTLLDDATEQSLAITDTHAQEDALQTMMDIDEQDYLDDVNKLI